MFNRGVWVVLVMAILGVSAGVSTVWYHYHTGHQAAEFWGPQASQLVARAPRVELLKIEPAPPPAADGQAVAIGGRTYRVVARRDISTAPGMSNARRALQLDATFAPADERALDADWNWLLVFSGEGDGPVEVAFAPQCGQVALAAQYGQVALAANPARRQALVERSAAALAAFFAEQFAPVKSPQPQ